MGKRTSYPPGTFSWVDLATTDGGAAKSFYADLFGWEMQDDDAGDGVFYTTCRLDGDAVCGLFEMSEDIRADGIPPSWTSYITVEDVDAVVSRAEELGGGAIEEPFEVLDAGRMALLRDPQGAVFAIWRPRTRIGAERVNDVGCLCMNELATADIDASRAFYEGTFGWTTELVDLGPGAPAGFFQNDGRINASIFSLDGGVLSHWRACFTVESTETALERVRQLGGQALVEPVDIGDGSLATAMDPQGARLMLFAGETDP